MNEKTHRSSILVGGYDRRINEIVIERFAMPSCTPKDKRTAQPHPS